MQELLSINSINDQKEFLGTLLIPTLKIRRSVMFEYLRQEPWIISCSEYSG